MDINATVYLSDSAANSLFVNIIVWEPVEDISHYIVSLMYSNGTEIKREVKKNFTHMVELSDHSDCIDSVTVVSVNECNQRSSASTLKIKFYPQPLQLAQEECKFRCNETEC